MPTGSRRGGERPDPRALTQAASIELRQRERDPTQPTGQSLEGCLPASPVASRGRGPGLREEGIPSQGRLQLVDPGGLLVVARKEELVNPARIARLEELEHEEVLSAELYSKGIAVTVVCPGMVRSNLIADGLMRLPGAWPQFIDQAYANFATRPEWLAGQILGAVKRRRSVVVPSLALAQFWRVKRWSGRLYSEMARELTRGLVRLGERA